MLFLFQFAIIKLRKCKTMKLLYNDTILNLTTKITDSNIGINEKDKWCLINISINNKDTNYEITEELLTKKEIDETINKINLFQEGIIKSINIKYIKNYIKIKLSNKSNKKILELNLIEPKNKSNKTHTIYLEDNEITTFTKLLKGE